MIREHWPAFRERATERGGLPKFVERDFDEYLRCGVLEHGLVHLRCGGSGQSMVVAFSCKRRGFCPSCLGRRMSDLAAHLCDRVLPEVPIRQWVCSLPWKLRYPMGFDRKLCAEVLGAFIGALERCLRRRAKRELGLRSVRDAHTAAITFVQRSDASLRLNVHYHTYHTLALDGVYVRGEDGALVFRALAAPTAQDVAEVAALTHRRLRKVLAKHGRSLDEGDELEDVPLPARDPAVRPCAQFTGFAARSSPSPRPPWVHPPRDGRTLRTCCVQPLARRARSGADSRAGCPWRHGAHHVAQKSTTTGRRPR